MDKSDANDNDPLEENKKEDADANVPATKSTSSAKALHFDHYQP